MKKTQKTLTWEFYTPIVLSILLILIYELELLPSGLLTDNKSAEFIVVMSMELITICVIPLALRLFKFKKVHESLTDNSEKSAENLLRWGSLRINMLSIPMVVNTVMYYLFMNVAFGYMAIILFLCFFFIVPTMDRCISETTESDNKD